MVADQCYGGRVVRPGVGHRDGATAVAFPHTALRAEGIHDAADEREEIEVGRLPGAEGLEWAELHQHALVPGKRRQCTHLRFGKEAVLDFDAADVINNHRRLREAATHAVQLRDVVHAHQEAQREVVRGAGGKHPLVAGMVQPAWTVAEGRPSPATAHAEGIDAAGGQRDHRLVRVGEPHVAHRRDHARADERLGVLGDEVHDVAVVQAVPGHLDEVHPHGADGATIARVVIGRERGEPEVGPVESWGERVAVGVGAPDVDVRVYDPAVRFGGHALWASAVSSWR